MPKIGAEVQLFLIPIPKGGQDTITETELCSNFTIDGTKQAHLWFIGNFTVKN